MTHTGAIARGLAYPPTPIQAMRAPASTAAVPPHAAPAAPEAGADPLALYKMSSFDRIRAEVAMIADSASRDLAVRNQQRAEIRAVGTFIDLRV